MNSSRKSLSDLSVVGGGLALDFANTVDWRGRTERIDYLSDYRALAGWWQFIGLIRPGEADRLTRKAQRFPEEAERVLAGAIRLRESIYAVFAAVSQGRPPGQDDLKVINGRLAEALAGACLRVKKGGISTEYEDRDKNLDWPLKPVVRSAQEVLTLTDPERIKICGDAECGWLFIDRSKNKSRRWCDMGDCGNRAKAGRFYRRKKQAPPQTPDP